MGPFPYPALILSKKTDSKMALSLARCSFCDNGYVGPALPLYRGVTRRRNPTARPCQHYRVSDCFLSQSSQTTIPGFMSESTSLRTVVLNSWPGSSTFSRLTYDVVMDFMRKHPCTSLAGISRFQKPGQIPRTIIKFISSFVIRRISFKNGNRI